MPFATEKRRLITRIVSTAAVCVFFCVFFLFGPYNEMSKYAVADAVCVLVFSICLIALTALFFMKERIKSDVAFVSLPVIAAAALLLRINMLNAVSNDYQTFLSSWVETMRHFPGVKPITEPIGDYNMPYLYYLFGISRVNISDLYLIKLLSVTFDFILAFGAVKLCRYFKKTDTAALFAFGLTLFVPTFFLNSAYWAQCDSIYAAFCLWGLYFALSKKGAVAMTFFGLAFSFKLQTVFILPIIIFLLLRHKITIKQIFFAPAAFILTLVPALLCGRSFYDTFSIYIDQTQNYPSLSMNCPTLWSLFPEGEFDFFGSGALFIAGAVCLAFCVYLYMNRAFLSDRLLFDAALIFTLIMPFFLPRMHERYFYLAEALSIIYVFLHRGRFVICPAIVFTGFCCYYNYFYGFESTPSMLVLTVINLATIIYVCKKFTDDISAAHITALSETTN